MGEGTEHMSGPRPHKWAVLTKEGLWLIYISFRLVAMGCVMTLKKVWEVCSGFTKSLVSLRPTNPQKKRKKKEKKKKSNQLSFRDLINLEPNFDLYHDQITF